MAESEEAAETPIVYACTHIAKRVEEDDFERGCLPETSRYVWSESVNIAAGNLSGLFEAIASRYAFDFDSIWVGSAEDGKVAHVSWNRLETDEADKPTEAEIRRWKRGRLRLWLADYDFSVEKRLVQPVEVAEFAPAGVATHE